MEIDALEYYGHAPDIYHSTVHVWPKIPELQHKIDHIQHTVPYGSLTDTFHDYGVSVEADLITFYLDRREMGRIATPPELQRPLFILLNLALGSGWQSIRPRTHPTCISTTFAPMSGSSKERVRHGGRSEYGAARDAFEGQVKSNADSSSSGSMRLIHLANHCEWGGNVNLAVDLACIQARDGHDVVFASAGGQGEQLLGRTACATSFCRKISDHP